MCCVKEQTDEGNQDSTEERVDLHNSDQNRDERKRVLEKTAR